jgi:tetratricopeptide (TPR) repeat protein
VESVSFIAARGSEFCGFYYLLALLFFIKHRVKERESGFKVKCFKDRLLDKDLIFSAIAFLFSFLAKEFAVTILIVMLAYDIAYMDNTKKTGYKAAGLTYVPYIVLTCVYLIARNIATKGANSITMLVGDIFSAEIFLRLIDAVRIIAGYAGKLLVPGDLVTDYGFQRSTSLFSINALVALGLLAGIIFLLNRLRKSEKPVFISVMLFLSPLILICGILPIKGATAIADRWLYIPAAGFSLVAAYCIDKALGKFSSRTGKVVVLNMVIIMVALFSFKTIERNSVFKDELSLWSDTVKKSPMSFKAHLNYGYALYNAGFTDDAYNEYLRALEIKPESAKAQYNIAVFYQNNMDYERAIQEYEKIASSGNLFYEVSLNLAECYQEIGDKIEALFYYKRALNMYPKSLEALIKISALYSDLKNEDKAFEYKKRYDDLRALK